jgi:gliding motility-associated-like protein
MKIKLTLLFGCFLFVFDVIAQNTYQCSSLPIPQNACGTLLASGGLMGETVFCENQDIIFNNTTAVTADSTMYCWGDGSFDVLPGNRNGEHRYAVPDTCFSISQPYKEYTITMIVFKKCTGGYSVGKIASSVLIRARPRIVLSTISTLCEGQSVQLSTTNTCLNDIADSIRCRYRLDNGAWQTGCNLPNFGILPVGAHNLEYEVTNRCGSRTASLPFSVTGLPRASGTIQNGAIFNGSRYRVCLARDSVRSDTLRFDASGSLNSSVYRWIVTATNPLTGLWRFVDSATANLTLRPRIQFLGPGTYTVTLETFNGCSPSGRQTMTIDVLPNINLPPQQDVCAAFDYVRTPQFSVNYRRYFNSALQVGSATSFRALEGVHIVEAYRDTGGGCPQMLRDTFIVQSAARITFTSPIADTMTVCPNSGRISLTTSSDSGRIFSANVIRVGTDYFFDANRASVGSLSQVVVSNTCGVGDTLFVRVRDTIRADLPIIASSCQPINYRVPNPIPNARYYLDGQLFDPNLVQRITALGNHQVRMVLQDVCDSIANDSDVVVRTFQYSGVQPIQLANRDTTVCRQSSAFALYGTPASGIWSGTGISGRQFDPIRAGVGRYVLYFRAGTGECANNDSVVVTVQGLTVEAGADIAVCNNLSRPPITLGSGTPSGGVYRLGTTSGQVLTQIDPRVLPVGNSLIFYTITTNGVCANYDSLTVRINAIPTATPNVPAIACAGVATNLQVTNPMAGLTYTWTADNARIGAGATLSYNFNTPSTPRIGLIVSNGICADTSTQSLTVRRPPQANLSASTQRVCEGERVQIRTNAGQNDLTTTYQYVFRGQTVNLNLLDSLQMNNANRLCQDSTYALNLTANTGGCPSATNSMNFLVSPQSIIRIGGNQRVDSSACSNESVLFVNNSCVRRNANYDWTIDGQRFNVENPASMRFVNTSDTVRLVNVKLIVTDSCRTDSSFYRLKIYPLSFRARFTFNQRVGCAPLTVDFRSLTPFASSTLFLFPDGTSNTSSTVTKRFDTAGTYVVRFAIFHPCNGRDTISDTIVVLPTPQTNRLGFVKIDSCNERVLRITPNVQNGVANRIWSPLGVVDSLRNRVTFPQSGLFWVYYSAVNSANGCTALDSGQVIVRPSMQLDTTVFKDLCGNGSGKVQLSGLNGAPPYRFFLDTLQRVDGIFVGIKTGEQNIFSMIDTRGCRIDQPILMSGSRPLAINIGRDTVVYACDSFFRRVSTNFTPQKVQWLVSSGRGTFSSQGQLSNQFRAFETAVVQVTAEDSAGCKISDKFKVTTIEELNVFVPNAFSPNGDGENDRFKPDFGNPNAQVVAFKVFDRWGNTVYAVENISAALPNWGWDGRVGGELVNPNVFTWFLLYQGCDGTVQILKEGDVSVLR